MLIIVFNVIWEILLWAQGCLFAQGCLWLRAVFAHRGALKALKYAGGDPSAALRMTRWVGGEVGLTTSPAILGEPFFMSS